jgi:hypothetical protein
VARHKTLAYVPFLQQVPEEEIEAVTDLPDLRSLAGTNGHVQVPQLFALCRLSKCRINLGFVVNTATIE